MWIKSLFNIFFILNFKMSQQIIQCENCIKPRVCYLQSNPEIGWCEECCKCRKCREENIKSRIEWDILIDSCGNTHRLCKDVCSDCEKKVPYENDCQCSKSANNRSVHNYIYL